MPLFSDSLIIACGAVAYAVSPLSPCPSYVLNLSDHGYRRVMTSKAEEAAANKAIEEEGPPAYSAEDEAGPSTASPAEPPQPPQPPQPGAESLGKRQGPTSESPFNFPSDAPPPAYSAGSSSSASKKPLVIPQKDPSAASPFLQAYSPILLSRGITADAWVSFLETLSAFLAAKVSDRAIGHAADVAKKVGEHPKNAFKGVFNHAKYVGKGISNNAKRGNIVGAAMGVVGGAVSIPVSAAFGTVRAVVGLPGSAVSAVATKPQTPRDRAAAYIAVANEDWLQARGLYAALVDTTELCRATGLSTNSLLTMTRAAKTKSAQARLATLNEHIAEVEVEEETDIELGEKTLWLILNQ